MAVDLTTELAKVLDGSQIMMRPEDFLGDVDGGGKVVVCKGDLPQGCSIRGARAIVIDGEVLGQAKPYLRFLAQRWSLLW
ncbi:MAG: hypothetical protein ACI8V2_004610, partial [Candidatus Latescibacterota bacterium]